MHALPEHRDVLSLGHLSSPRDVASVLDNARRLQRQAQAGETHPLLLRGKHLGLLCEDDTDACATLFCRAALELGAHVAHIRPSASGLATPPDVQRTARILGRLYDAVECQGMPTALVRQLRRDAGVPVYDGIASREHPSAGLADSLGAGGSPADKRRFVLQAALLQTIANL